MLYEAKFRHAGFVNWHIILNCFGMGSGNSHTFVFKTLFFELTEAPITDLNFVKRL